MNIELSNGLDHLFQWDKGQKVKISGDIPTVHFKWGNDAVSFDVVDGWVEIAPELTQKPGDIYLWTYNEDHTLDAARIPVAKRPKPTDYIYTPTEIKTWESLDKRIEALEKGGGVAGVTSVNGKTGAVKLTAEDVGAATEEYVDNNSKLFVINITDSLNDSNDKVYSADKTYSEILDALNNGLLPVCKMPKHTTGSYVYGLCYFSGKLTPPIGSDRFIFRSLDTDTFSSKRTVVHIDPSNYVEVTSEPVVMTGATDSRSGVPGYVPFPQSSERNYFLRGDAKWKPALQPPVIASVGQYLSVKTVDDNGIVTETEAVDAPSAEDLSLGLTGATVGQTVKISAVDDNGVPTAWEPVDMASGIGETWELINEVTLSEDAMAVVFDKDKIGATFALQKFAVVGTTKGSNASNTSGGVICINVANTPDDKYSIVPPISGHGALKGDQIRYWHAVAESMAEKGWRWYITGADNTWKTQNVTIGTDLKRAVQTNPKVATYLALWSRTSGSAFAAGSKIELYGVRV